jgi:hypothetical protein
METGHLYPILRPFLSETPYFVGKLIEWKPCGVDQVLPDLIGVTPYFVGKLIEWKRFFQRGGLLPFNPSMRLLPTL